MRPTGLPNFVRNASCFGAFLLVGLAKTWVLDVGVLDTCIGDSSVAFFFVPKINQTQVEKRAGLSSIGQQDAQLAAE